MLVPKYMYPNVGTEMYYIKLMYLSVCIEMYVPKCIILNLKRHIILYCPSHQYSQQLLSEEVYFVTAL